MDTNVTIKEEIDICDYEITPQKILNGTEFDKHLNSLNNQKMNDVRSGEPFSIFNEDHDMITVNVGSLQSEEERNFIKNIDFEKMFTNFDVTNVCAFCQKTFTNVESFLEHKKHSLCQFFWLQPHSCSLCSLVFESKHKLDKHHRLHQRKMHFCQTGCGKFFRKLECCLEHEYRDHSGEERKFKCRICSKMLPSSNQLMQHVSSIHAYVHRYVCSLCRSDFESAVELKQHWATSIHTCGAIKFDDPSYTSGELVLVNSLEDKRRPESENKNLSNEFPVRTEDKDSHISFPEIKMEPMDEDESEFIPMPPILNNLENVKLEIKQEPNDETENGNDITKYDDYIPRNTSSLSHIQCSDTILDISKLRLPSIRRESQVPATQSTLVAQKQTTSDPPILSSHTKAPERFENQPTCKPTLQKGIKLSAIKKTKSSNTAKSCDNVKLKNLVKAGVPLIENSAIMNNSMKYFKVIPLQTNQKVSISDCKTRDEVDEVNENINSTKDNKPNEIRVNNNNNNNHLKHYNVLNLPSSAKIIPLHLLKVSPTSENKTSLQMISPTSSTTPLTTSIPTNIKIVKLSQCQFVNMSLQPNSQNDIQPSRRNYCLTNDTMSYIEALPESRKVIEDFKNKIRSIEQTSPVLDAEPQNNCTALTEKQTEMKDSSEFQQIMEEICTKSDTPTSLYVTLGAAVDKSIMRMRSSYPDYVYVWMCPKCPRQFELKHAFRTHLATTHGMKKDEYKKLQVEFRPLEKEENCSKSTEPLSLYLSLSAESDKTLMHVRWANPEYRFSWICPKCPRQYELKYAFRTHLTSAHGMYEDEYKKLQFVVRPFKLISPMKAKKRLNETNVAPTEATSSDVKEVKELIDHATTNENMKDANISKSLSKSKGGKPRQYECTVCLKRFSASGTLNCHMSIHTGELPYKCNYCDKRFRTRGQVTVHHRTHTGERPFTCQVCSLGFTHRETLISHLSRHIGMKRYKCYGCDKTFSCISGLRTHRDVRPDSCGLVKFSPRAIGPRVRVVRGNVIFEQQPKVNPYLRSDEPPEVIDTQVNVKGA